MLARPALDVLVRVEPDDELAERHAGGEINVQEAVGAGGELVLTLADEAEGCENKNKEKVYVALKRGRAVYDE